MADNPTMNQALQDLGDYVAGQRPREVARFEIRHDQLILWTDADGVVRLLTFLRDDSNCLFKLLVDIAGHEPGEPRQLLLARHPVMGGIEHHSHSSAPFFHA